MNMKQYINSAIASRYFQFFVTVILFIVLYGIGIAMYNGFLDHKFLELAY